MTKVPIPFVTKTQRGGAEQDEAEARKNRDWDPNAPLAGKAGAAKPAPAPTGPVNPVTGRAGRPAVAPATAPPTAAPPVPCGGAQPPRPAPVPAEANAPPPSNDPLGDLARPRSGGGARSGSTTTASAAPSQQQQQRRQQQFGPRSVHVLRAGRRLPHHRRRRGAARQAVADGRRGARSPSASRPAAPSTACAPAPSTRRTTPTASRSGSTAAAWNRRWFACSADRAADTNSPELRRAAFAATIHRLGRAG